MIETCKLAEAEWPDFAVAEEREAQAGELKYRRDRDRLAACERLGLRRQAQLQVAAAHYERFDVERHAGPFGESGKRIYMKDSTTYSKRIDFETYRVAVRIDDHEQFNRQIPYSVLLAMEEAAALRCFDRFAVMAPREDFELLSDAVRDPLLLGVVEAPTQFAAHAAYFVIIGWE